MRKENPLTKNGIEYANTLSQNKKYCIYFLACPFTNSIKYIGMTKNVSMRFKNHLIAKQNKRKWDWIKYLLEHNTFPKLTIMAQFDNVKKAAIFEQGAITLHEAQIINGKHAATYPVKRALRDERLRKIKV